MRTTGGTSFKSALYLHFRNAAILKLQNRNIALIFVCVLGRIDSQVPHETWVPTFLAFWSFKRFVPSRAFRNVSNIAVALRCYAPGRFNFSMHLTTNCGL